jgi:polyribonucleotide nucleotidyltransferase
MIKKVEMELEGGKVLSFETGRVAREAGGAVIVRLGDTMVLATATVSDVIRANLDFFPLIVDFEEKLYAAGKIPGGFFKREGRPTETAILTARRIDRPIRPLFPDGLRNDVQIVVTPLSVDQENSPDILAMIGASTALSISEIPWNGPVGSVRVGKIGDSFVLNPGPAQMQQSSVDLIVCGTKDAIMMIEAGGEEMSEEEIVSGIEFAHKWIKDIIKLQEDLVKAVGRKKHEFAIYAPDPKIEKFVSEKAEKKIVAAMGITDKNLQCEELDKIKREVKDDAEGCGDTGLKELVARRPNDIGTLVDEIEKRAVREMIVSKGKRPDGRGADEIRQISCEVGILPRAHGSAIFTRGGTQVLTVATLGAAGEAQRIEGYDAEEGKKRYMHHYNFPAFSVGEVRPLRGPGRREIGHGALAERALLPVIPGEDKFPYTIRLVSEVLGSNGSTSMASTCGSTLALLDAGIPIDASVAGISIGLVKEGSKEILLTDIQGMEDHHGDMDFKVAGTMKGITSVQVDLKIPGISFALIRQALEKAKKARVIILGKMNDAIAAPRSDLSPYAPRVIMLSIPQEKIGLVIGPGGKTIKKIIEETNAQIDIEDDGRVFITSSDKEALEIARKRIEQLTFEPKIGDVFYGRVTRIMNFGAFVEMVPGREGLVHISQLSDKRVNRVEDVAKVGDMMFIKLVEIDDMGRLNLSRTAVTPEDEKRAVKS